MKTNLTKSEKLIVISTTVAVSVFFMAFLKVTRGVQSSLQIENGSAINYKMARPEQAYSEYNLDGREVDETFEGLPAERELAKTDKKNKESTDKKVAEAKKKEEDKKKTQAVKAQEQSRSKLGLQADPAQVQRAANSQTNKRESTQVAKQFESQVVSVNQAQPTKPVEEQNVKANKKTFAEWRNLLFAKPTSESLSIFIAAFRKNEVTSTEYQAMAQDLIDQDDVNLKGLGLMALRAVPSLTSLSQLAHLNSANLGNLQKYVEESLNAYLQSQNIQYLNQALLTKDKTLIVKSLNLLNTNLAKFGQGDFSSLVDARNRREGGVTAFSMSSYSILVPALTQLGASGDQELAALAHQVSSYIQTSNNIAQF